jgi:hypothetical protein
VIPVRGRQRAFWGVYDDLPEDDPRREEIQGICWALVEQGPLIPGARVALVPYLKTWKEGYSVALSDGSAFIEYIELRDVHTQEAFIGLWHLIFFDG